MKTYNFKKIAASNLGQLIAELKDVVTIDEVVDKLDLRIKCKLQKAGSLLQGDCPTGHPSSGHHCFSVDIEDGLYYCFSCKIGGDIIELVALVQNVNRFQASKWIAEQFVPNLLQKFEETMADQTEEQREYNERAILYKLVFEEGKRQLYDTIGQPVLKYLVQDRGYITAKLHDTEWIYWDIDKNIRTYLLSKMPQMKEQIDVLDLQGAFGDQFRLALPYRDRQGLITGFLKRAPVKAGFSIGGRLIRWDSTKGLKKSDLFGLHRIKKIDDLVIVEGYPDATYLPTEGIDNIVAIGQAAFSEKYIDGLKARGIKRLIIALDNDGGTGIRNTEEVVRLFAGSEIRAFVIDPPLMDPHKDPDEFIMAKGANAFKLLVKNAELGSSWLTKRILAKYPITTDLGRETAIAECLEYADSLGIPREIDAVLKSLSASLDLTDDVLAEEYKLLEEKQAADRLNNGIGKVTSRAHELIVDGEPEKALRVLQDDMSVLQTDYWRSKEPTKENLDDFLVGKRERDIQRVLGQRIGYELKDFAEIDQVISGLQSGLYIVAADPNIGKTAFMVSLMIDVLKSNPDAICLFYSMDDSRDTIVNRMLAHLTDKKINDVRFKQQDPLDEQTLDNAYSLLTSWYRQGRLEIKEASAYLTMSRIQSEIQMHERREKLVVFIDGLYNVPVDEDHGSLREENIDRANQVKQ
jgi:DNA primase